MDYALSTQQLRLNNSAQQLRLNNSEARKIAQEHNQTIPLIACPSELSSIIFNYFVDNKSLSKNIQNILVLSATCSHFDNKLEYFGSLLKSYNSKPKHNIPLEVYISQPNVFRRGNLLMIYSGIDYDDKKLFENATICNDAYMVNLLFQKGVSPNLCRTGLSVPIFFEIRGLEIATIFATNNTDFSASGLYAPNVLWYILEVPFFYENFDEIIQFYLNNGVNAALRKTSTGDLCCIK
jgi:hypothetical protein